MLHCGVCFTCGFMISSSAQSQSLSDTIHTACVCACFAWPLQILAGHKEEGRNGNEVSKYTSVCLFLYSHNISTRKGASAGHKASSDNRYYWKQSSLLCPKRSLMKYHSHCPCFCCCFDKQAHTIVTDNHRWTSPLSMFHTDWQGLLMTWNNLLRQESRSKLFDDKKLIATSADQWTTFGCQTKNLTVKHQWEQVLSVQTANKYRVRNDVRQVTEGLLIVPKRLSCSFWFHLYSTSQMIFTWRMTQKRSSHINVKKDHAWDVSLSNKELICLVKNLAVRMSFWYCLCGWQSLQHWHYRTSDSQNFLNYTNCSAIK